jgi:hypothetical protein
MSDYQNAPTRAQVAGREPMPTPRKPWVADTLATFVVVLVMAAAWLLCGAYNAGEMGAGPPSTSYYVDGANAN